MSVYVVKDAQLYLGGHDLTGVSNQINLTYEGEEVDRTTMTPDGARQFLAGLLVSRLTGNGFVKYADGGYDEAIYQNMGLSRTPLTVGPESGADGAVAFFVQANKANYEAGATVGELMAYSLSAVGTDTKLVRGRIMETGTKETSETGVIRELGAVSATQKVYAALHVFAAEGTTLDVKVQSDALEGFGDPTDRIEFDQVTTDVTSEFKSADGAITDTWWRVDYTVTGGSPEYQFVVVIGIS